MARGGPAPRRGVTASSRQPVKRGVTTTGFGTAALPVGAATPVPPGDVVLVVAGAVVEVVDVVDVVVVVVRPALVAGRGWG